MLEEVSVASVAELVCHWKMMERKLNKPEKQQRRGLLCVYVQQCERPLGIEVCCIQFKACMTGFTFNYQQLHNNC